MRQSWEMRMLMMVMTMSRVAVALVIGENIICQRAGGAGKHSTPSAVVSGNNDQRARTIYILKEFYLLQHFQHFQHFQLA